MEFSRTEMGVAPRHRQALLPEKIGDIFKRSALHSETACERMPQIVPAKILDPRFDHRIVELVASVFERFAGLGRLKHTPSPMAALSHHS
jgi:hypothetical protein